MHNAVCIQHKNPSRVVFKNLLRGLQYGSFCSSSVAKPAARSSHTHICVLMHAYAAIKSYDSLCETC